LLRHADAGERETSKDAETSPQANPERYRYHFQLAEVAELWRRGSVISSWLLDLTAHALAEDPDLSHLGGRVADSGEGRWALQAAVDVGVPASILSIALNERLASRGEQQFADKVLSALRKEFGGHIEKQP
jgi:6-phosphogluconate dehydrogenase